MSKISLSFSCWMLLALVDVNFFIASEINETEILLWYFILPTFGSLAILTPLVYLITRMFVSNESKQSRELTEEKIALPQLVRFLAKTSGCLSRAC